MKSNYITFRSVTVAQRGERVLHKAGIDAALQRTPRWMEERGCGYSLSVRSRDMMRSVELLRENRVEFSKLYLRKDNGNLEEVVL